MGLYKQEKSKNWFMRFTDEHGRTIRRSTKTANKSAAAIMLSDEQRAVLNRRLGVASPSPTGASAPIREVIKRFLKSELAIGITPEWIKTQQSRFDLMIAYFDWRSIKDITTEGLKEYIEHHPTAKCHSTKCEYIMHVSKLCKWAINQSPPMLASNPAADAMPRLVGKQAKVEENRDVRRPLWSFEIPLFLSARPTHAAARRAWDTHRLPLYIIALRTGFRRSTLRDLTPASIHLHVANPHILVPAELTKSGRQINMPLTDRQVIDCAEHLICESYRRRRSDPSYGHPFAPVPRPRTFQADLARAGIERVDELGRHVVFHSLRSTFCTQLALSGTVPQAAMELMDHEDLRTTMKYYTKVGVSDKRRFIENLPKLELGSNAGMSQSMLQQRHTEAHCGVC